MDKKCGILLPVFSLPSKYGIGTFGKWAYKYIDFLKKSGHSYWQMLPLVQTGSGDSPYSTCSDISGNPYYIDPEILRDEKLLTYREVEAIIDKSETINYGKLYNERFPLLRKAFSRFDTQSQEFKAFLKKGKFNDYAMFMALHEIYKTAWYDWEDGLKCRNAEALKAFAKVNKKEILFWQFLQFEFEKQYKALKKYANSNGIKIMGDLPLYVAYDSVEVWTKPEEFLLDEGYRPTLVAGVPPDYFCEEGQHWGNPIYNYAKMKENGYSFWVNRVNNALSLYDNVRLDHFRGLASYWAIPSWAKSAKEGHWEKGPGMDLISNINSKCMFAEDLGLIDDGVKSLLAESKMPGMKVLLFAFDSDENNLYLPWSIDSNSVIYTGTHDNNTLIGALKALDKNAFESQRNMVKKSLDYLKIYKTVSGVYSTADAIIDIAYASKSDLAIIPMQDILMLGEEYRVNTPGVIGCWTMRLKESVFTENLASLLKRKAKRFNRT